MNGAVKILWIFAFLKILLFDILWCINTTFVPFSYISTYLSILLFTFIIVLPYIITGRLLYSIVLFFLADILFVANLLYFRTYFSPIPLKSYGLISNLSDFTDSIVYSFQWVDILFPVTSFLPAWIGSKIYRPKEEIKVPRLEPIGRIKYLLALSLLFFAMFFQIGEEGFRNKYESLQNANMHTCGTVMYTLFGNLWYEFQKGEDSCTEGMKQEMEVWLAAHSGGENYQETFPAKSNCIIILAESFESWVLEQRFEGKEITPFLNRLLKDSSTLYAPYVLSQVKGGRSIDAQLLINTGLLPIENGSYSTIYPNRYYPSLVKAFKEKHPAGKAYITTVDKQIVWNQGVVAHAFGYDQVIDRSRFKQEEKVGPRKKTGDVSFLRQCAQKIASGEIWQDQGNNFLQCVTYSGHFPFILPDQLKKIRFSGEIPPMLNDYMTMANYTDYAIGLFIDSLKAQGKYDNTLIVITGDHEGLAGSREALAHSDAGRGLVHDKQYTPFIVLNAPKGLRYEKVMGQVDIYPTLLDLLGLSNYPWKGLGKSILSEDHPGYAVDPRFLLIANGSINKNEKEQSFMKQAWNISDALIRYDYLKEWLGGNSEMKTQIIQKEQISTNHGGL